MLPSWTEKARSAAFMSATRPGKRARAAAVKLVSPMAPKANGRPAVAVAAVAAVAAMAGVPANWPIRVRPRPMGTNHRLRTAASNHRPPPARQVFRGGRWDRIAPQREEVGVPGDPGAGGSGGAGDRGGAGGWGGAGGCGGLDGG